MVNPSFSQFLEGGSTCCTLEVAVDAALKVVVYAALKVVVYAALEVVVDAALQGGSRCCTARWL